MLIQTVIQMKSMYVIPANDDAIRAVKLLTGKMADAILEAKQGEESLTQACKLLNVIITYVKGDKRETPLSPFFKEGFYKKVLELAVIG